MMAKILIAEDEPDIRKLIKFTLEYAGHQVIVTQNGTEVLENAQEMAEKNQPPDLIILDVRMPRMTGYEVCKRIKEIDKLASVPVVFLSAKGQEAEIQTGMEVGATAYIVKPFAPDQLTKKIAELLS
jgi:DNA-binding response OmpR family regulator